jgi:hypothetical protein
LTIEQTYFEVREVSVFARVSDDEVMEHDAEKYERVAI